MNNAIEKEKQYDNIKQVRETYEDKFIREVFRLGLQGQHRLQMRFAG